MESFASLVSLVVGLFYTTQEKLIFSFKDVSPVAYKQTKYTTDTRRERHRIPLKTWKEQTSTCRVLKTIQARNLLLILLEKQQSNAFIIDLFRSEAS